MDAQLRPRVGRALRRAATAINGVVACALMLAFVRVLLGTTPASDVTQTTPLWVWPTALAVIGLVAGRWWIVPAMPVLVLLAGHYQVFTGALRSFSFEWPFGGLVQLVIAAAAGSGVLVRYMFNRLAGGPEWPGLGVSIPFLLIAVMAPGLVWTTFLDPQPIATLGPPPLLTAAELHDRASEAPYPVYAAGPDLGLPASAGRSVSRVLARTVVSDTFYVVYRGPDRQGLDDVMVMTSPAEVAQPGRVVSDRKGPNGQIQEEVQIAPHATPLAVFDESGRTWEVSAPQPTARFNASTQIDGVRVSISARDRAKFDDVAQGLRQVE